MSDQSTKFGWGHININVRDLDQSIAFYEKLGFTVFLPGIPYLGLSRESGQSDLPDPCAIALGISSIPRDAPASCSSTTAFRKST